jgi:hypothetical protein
MTRRRLLHALFVVLAAGGVILVIAGVAADRSERVWTGVGLLVGSLVCVAVILAPRLRRERARQDVVLAHPHAIVLFGQLDESLTGESSALVADAASVRVLATRDREVSVALPWLEVTGVSMRTQAVPGGQARALVIRRVAGDDLTFWVERALMPLDLEELERLRSGAPEPYAGTSHNPASGGSVSSTDAGRPPNGSSVASTDP